MYHYHLYLKRAAANYIIFYVICRAPKRGRRKVKMGFAYRLTILTEHRPQTWGQSSARGLGREVCMRRSLGSVLFQKPINPEGGYIIKEGDEFWHQACLPKTWILASHSTLGEKGYDNTYFTGTPWRLTERYNPGNGESIIHCALTRAQLSSFESLLSCYVQILIIKLGVMITLGYYTKEQGTLPKPLSSSIWSDYFWASLEWS